MSVCFWREDAVRSNVPEERHLQVLRGLYSHLKPDLEKKPWPAEAYRQNPAEAYRQNPPQRKWPNSNGIIYLYKIRLDNCIRLQTRLRWVLRIGGALWWPTM